MRLCGSSRNLLDFEKLLKLTRDFVESGINSRNGECERVVKVTQLTATVPFQYSPSPTRILRLRRALRFRAVRLLKPLRLDSVGLGGWCFRRFPGCRRGWPRFWLLFWRRCCFRFRFLRLFSPFLPRTPLSLLPPCLLGQDFASTWRG
jgi:hypothetical protein